MRRSVAAADDFIHGVEGVGHRAERGVEPLADVLHDPLELVVTRDRLRFVVGRGVMVGFPGVVRTDALTRMCQGVLILRSLLSPSDAFDELEGEPVDAEFGEHVDERQEAGIQDGHGESPDSYSDVAAGRGCGLG